MPGAGAGVELAVGCACGGDRVSALALVLSWLWAVHVVETGCCELVARVCVVETGAGCRARCWCPLLTVK